MLSVYSILKPIVNKEKTQSIVLKRLSIISDLLSRTSLHFDFEIRAQQKHLLSDWDQPMILKRDV